jgi:hypothetical protein
MIAAAAAMATRPIARPRCMRSMPHLDGHAQQHPAAAWAARNPSYNLAVAAGLSASTLRHQGVYHSGHGGHSAASSTSFGSTRSRAMRST